MDLLGVWWVSGVMVLLLVPGGGDGGLSRFPHFFSITKCGSG